MDPNERLLRSIARAQARFISDEDPHVLFDGLLEDLLELTESEYGFIGEVRRDERGAPYLRTFALTNIAWDDETRRFYAENAPTGLEFRNLDTLFGEVLRTERPVIANDPANDPRGSGTPPGHPPLRAFLGVPFRSGRTFTGIAGVANRTGGYDEAMIEFLEPLLQTCGHLIEARRAAGRRDEMEEALRREGERLRAILNNVVEAIVMIDDDGTIQSVNRAATRMFGYFEHEMVGRPVAMLAPRTRPGEEERSLRHHLRHGGQELVGKTREVTGMRRGGTEFPIELSVGGFSSRGRRYFTAIVRDVTERNEIDELKSEFVSVVSHELRTPLTSIRGSLGLIEGGAAGELSEGAREMIRIARSNTDRLIRLINDILDLDKIESRKIELQRTRLPLRSVVETTLRGIATFAADRGVALRTEIDDEREVEADADRLVQVLTNLVSNAINHSGVGAVVRIQVGSTPAGRVRVSVHDEGTGVPLDQQERIFEKFHQADSSDTRARGGTGLGLPIAKGIVEQHGGRIGLDSEPGRGSTFWFELDAVERRVDRAGGRPAQAGPRPERAEIAARAPGLPEPLHRPTTILVVDGDAAARRVIAAQLARHDVRCVEAGDGESAVAAARIGDPDLIVMDVSLPVLDGFGLVEELRRGETASVPLVVFSGIELDAASRGRLALGPTRFLVKSITTDEELVETVLELLPTLAQRAAPVPGPAEPALV